MNQQELFDAHMIGDGSLIYRHKNRDKHPSFSMCNKQEQYLIWLTTQMEIFNERPVWCRSAVDKRTGNLSECYYLIALQRPEFSIEYQRWYSNNGAKNIPLDVNVSKEFLLHWYIDDGSLATHGGIYFAVDSYSRNRIEHLRDKLEVLTGCKIGIHKNGKGFRLYFAKKYREKFFNFIGPCPVVEYEYKWD